MHGGAWGADHLPARACPRPLPFPQVTKQELLDGYLSDPRLRELVSKML